MVLYLETRLIGEKMAHNRKLVLSGVSLTKARLNPHSFEVGPEVMDELEQIMISMKFLSSAPFKWVGGLKNEEAPHYQGIDQKDGELALAIELDAHDFQNADREDLKRSFIVATLKAIIHAGKQYSLPVKELEERLQKET